MSEDTIDKRQVSIHFDHADFEQGVAQTLASLNKLNTAVENSGNTSSKGFQNLSSQLTQVEKEINGGVLPAMDAMTNKFSFFGTMVDQMTRNFATKVQDTFSKGFGTIFQVKGGMNEYELKMNSIQTILNGTGRSLEDVKNNLEELNHYADKTIYSFKDMTDNIGKFTNNNVPLEKAVAAMKGIGNEAALSGATADQASRAMYNFSQALSMGSVKVIDWKSIEMAMMATYGFKDALVQTGVAMGTLKQQGDQFVTTTTNAMGKVSTAFDVERFRDSLQYNWLTSDVLLQTLELYATDVSKMTDAEKEEYEVKLKSIGFNEKQIKDFEELGIKAAKAATEIKTFSQMCDVVIEAIGTGWAETFEIIFGDFNEAKALWTGLYSWIEQGINNFTKFRNDILEMWKDNGGRENALKTFVNILNAIDAVLRPIGEAFIQVFGSINGRKLANFTEWLEQFTYGLILTNGQVDAIREKARMTFAIIKKLIEIFKPFAPAAIGVFSLVKAFTALNLVLSNPLGLGSFLGMFKTLLWLITMVEATKPYIPWDRLRAVVNNINLNNLIVGFAKFASTIRTVLGPVVKDLFDKLRNVKALESIINFFDRLGSIFMRIAASGKVSRMEILEIQNAFKDLFSGFSLDSFLNPFVNFFTRSKSAAKELSATVETITEPVSKSVGLFDGLKTRVENVAGSFNMVAYAAEESQKPVWYAAEGLNTMAEAAEEATEQVNDAVNDTDGFNTMAEAAEVATERIDGVGNVVDKVTDGMRGFTDQLENINPVAKNVLDVITTIASKINWAKVIAVGVIIVYINMIKKLDVTIQNVGTSMDKFGTHFDNLFGGIGSNLKNVTSSIEGTFTAITSYFNTLERQLTKDNFKNTAFGILALAGAFGILAAAIYFLPEDVMITAAISLAVLSGAVIGINYAMAKLSETVNPTGIAALAAGMVVFAATIAGMAASLLALGAAIAILKFVTGSIQNAISAIGVVLSTFVAIAVIGGVAIWSFAKLIAYLGDNKFALSILKGAGALAVMSASMIFFGFALNSLIFATIQAVTVVSGFITAIGTIVVGITTGMIALVKATTGWDTVTSTIVTLIAGFGIIAIGIQVAMIALRAVSNGIIAFSTKIAISGMLMGKGALGLAAGIVAVSLAIQMMVATMNMVLMTIFTYFVGAKLMITTFINSILSIKDAGDAFGRIIINIISILSVLGLAFVSFLGFKALVVGVRTLFNGIGKDLMYCAAAILLMSFALRAWAAIPGEQLISGGLALVATMALMTTALKILNFVNIGKIAGAVFALVAALYLLTPLAALYGLAWPILGKGLVTIAFGMLAIAGAVKLMEDVKVGKLIGIALALTAFIGTISYLAAMLGADFASNERGMTAAFVSIFAMLMTMAVVVDMISSSVKNMDSLGKLALVIVGFGVVVAGMVIALSALANFPADNVMAAAKALAISMLSFSTAILILVGAAKLLGDTNPLNLVFIMLSFAGAMFVLANGMSNLQGLGWGEILTFIGGFAVAIIGISIALGVFGPVLDAASVGIAAIALVFGAAALAAVGAGFGFKLMAEGAKVLFKAISDFLPIFMNFLSGLADLSERAEEIITTSDAIAAFAKSLVTLAVSMGLVAIATIPMTVAILAIAIAVRVVSNALIVAANAIDVFTESVVNAYEKLDPILGDTIKWGADLVGNFVEGMYEKLPDLVDAVTKVAETIWSYLHHSTPELGPLSTDDQWGGDFIGNIITSMDGKSAELGAESKSVGSILKDNFLSGADAEGTAKSFLDGIGDAIFNNQDGLILSVKGLGGQLKDAFKDGFSLDGLTSIFTQSEVKDEFLEQLNESIRVETNPSKKRRLTAQRDQYLRQKNVKKAKEEKNSTFDWKSLFNIGDELDTNKIKDELTEGLNLPDESAGKTGKTSAADLKKQREVARIHEQYLKIASNLTDQYVKSYGNLMVAMGDTNPTESAAAAIAKLKDNLYQASITADMTEEELTEAAQNAEKKIVESYENIRKKTMELFDGFKEFDSGLISMSPSKTILKNIEDASYGVSDMENLWRTLSLRKGMDQEYLAELIEGGAEKLGVVRSLVAMNNDEFDKYMNTITNRKELSEHAANVAMTAQAFALQRDEISKVVKTQKAYKSEGKKMIDAWNDAFNSGADNATEMCNRIAQDFANLAEQNGLTFEQLRDQITSTTATTEEELEKQINAYTNLASTVEQWKSTYMTSYEDVKNGLSGLSTDLSDFDLGDEKSGKHLYNNLAKRNKALGEWGRMLNDLASRGLDKAFLSNLAGQGLSSYQDVKALHSLDTDRLRQMNGMMQSIERQSEAIAKTYGANVANKMVEGVDEGLVDAFKKYAITEKVDWEGLAKEVGVNLELIGNNFSESLAAGMENNIGRVEQAVTTLTDMIINTTQNKIGNVDINARPIVYNDDGSYSTTSTTFQEKWTGDEETGHYRIGHFATIRENGTRLTDAELDAYIEKVLGSDDPFGVDAQMENLLYMVADRVSTGEYITDANLQQAFQEASAWDINMHNIQDQMYKDQAKLGQSVVVTPVVNLSAAQNDLKTLGTMTTISPLMPDTANPAHQITLPGQSNEDIAAAIRASQYDDTNLVNQVAGLRQDVTTLNDKMGNLQVVMDSGPLVGAIAPKMDVELGTIYRRKNRG